VPGCYAGRRITVFPQGAAPDALRWPSGRFFCIFRPAPCQNALAPPRYPVKTARIRRHITQMRHKNTCFAAVPNPPGTSRLWPYLAEIARLAKTALSP
jgi:hypothetical protein